jgi:hypothetical protein
MTSKEKRIVENDLKTLFSMGACIAPLTIEVWIAALTHTYRPQVDSVPMQRAPTSLPDPKMHAEF